VLAIVAVMSFSKDTEVTEPTQNTEATGTVETASSSVKFFAVSGTNFAFDPKEIRVKEGDRVKITLTGAGYPHDLKIDELGVATKIINAGETDTVEFVASKKGSFEYYCSVGKHREMGMVGTLIVE